MLKMRTAALICQEARLVSPVPQQRALNFIPSYSLIKTQLTSYRQVQLEITMPLTRSLSGKVNPSTLVDLSILLPAEAIALCPTRPVMIY
jgi:hypothetical protein